MRTVIEDDEDMLETEFVGVVAGQIRNAVSDIQLALRSANSGFRADSQVVKTIRKRDVRKSAVFSFGYAGVQAISGGVRIGRQLGHVCRLLIAQSACPASAKFIHPGGVRSPGPTAGKFLRLADTERGPVRLQARAARGFGSGIIVEAADMVPRRDLPVHLHETVIEWLCGRVPGVKDRRCRRIEWKYVLERTRCGRH